MNVLFQNSKDLTPCLIMRADLLLLVINKMLKSQDIRSMFGEEKMKTIQSIQYRVENNVDITLQYYESRIFRDAVGVLLTYVIHRVFKDAYSVTPCQAITQLFHGLIGVGINSTLSLTFNE